MKWWVAGSRGIRNYSVVSKVLEERIGKDDTIRTGGAQGVDRIAEAWARRNGIEVGQQLLPEWDRYGKGAGHVRNTKGVRWADAVIIIWDGRSPGSKHVISESIRLNVDYFITIYDNNI